MQLDERVAMHAALGDSHRLHIVDLLQVGDLTPGELADITGLPGNLLAHHLDVLEASGLVARHISAGDKRRRYVSLDWRKLDDLGPRSGARPASVVFVCSHNSARSQLAEALWRERIGGPAASAGTDPAGRVHPLAVKVATEAGLDLRGHEPRSYEQIPFRPDLVISVCDRAREKPLPDGGRHMHWSIEDPVDTGTITAFRDVRDELERRIEHLRETFEEERA